MENQSPTENPNQNAPIQSPQNQTPDLASQGVPLRSYRRFSFPRYLFLGIVFLILLAIIAAAYFLGGNSNNNSVPIPSPAPVVYQSPSPTPDPTADWQTYLNSEQKYSIRYPTTWTIDTNSQTDTNVTIWSNERFPRVSGDPEAITYWAFLIYSPNSNNLAFKDLVTKDLPEELKNNFSFTTETINGLQAYRTTSLPSMSGCEWVYFKYPENNNYVSVGFCLYDKDKPFANQDKFYSIFNQMLSTFRFD